MLHVVQRSISHNLVQKIREYISTSMAMLILRISGTFLKGGLLQAYIYIYIYTERETERETVTETERETDRQRDIIWIRISKYTFHLCGLAVRYPESFFEFGPEDSWIYIFYGHAHFKDKGYIFTGRDTFKHIYIYIYIYRERERESEYMETDF